MAGSDPVARALQGIQSLGREERRPIVGIAPGRVNLIGEHTDYTGGLVMPMAIDRYTAVAVRHASDGERSRVLATELNETWGVDLRQRLIPPTDREPGSGGVVRGSWMSYVAGVLAEFQRRFGLRENVELGIASDVPVGGGLSSSAALECAMVMALERYLGMTLTGRERAEIARQAEHEWAGVPCGIMDQFASVMGRAGHAMVIDCSTEAVEYVPMPSEREAVIVVMNTMVKHELASGEYAIRQSWCQRATTTLGIAKLSDASAAMVKAASGGMDEELLRAAEHVISENARVRDAVLALRMGDLAEFGQLMIASHVSLRDGYRVSCAELDVLVDGAISARGVFGARMTGGGFGGCAIALCAPSAVGALRERVCRRYRRRFGIEPEIMMVTASGGSRVVE